MKERLVQLLACPDCDGGLALVAGSVASDKSSGEIEQGALDCAGCARRFPITRGVPRLLPKSLESLATEVADQFGWQWNTFSELGADYVRQFRDWTHLEPEDVRGKRVLEGGCGKGRHTAIVAGWGARDVFAMDLGSAVEAAYRNVGALEPVHVIQADISRPPIKRCADLAYSVGVVHHMPRPIDGVVGLASKVQPGGRIVVWVYGYESNEWVVTLVNPVREAVTSKIPPRALFELSKPLAWLVAAASKGLYAPLAEAAPKVHARLFYKDYLTYIAKLSTREIHNIVFDQLVTPVAYYMRKGEVEALFDKQPEGPRFEALSVESLNGMSWRASAKVAG